LLDHSRLLGASPDYRVAALDEEAETHYSEGTERARGVGVVDADRNPAGGACGYASIVVDAEHVGDVGASKVDIEDANRVAGEGK
jgi:hypothetical protein